MRLFQKENLAVLIDKENNIILFSSLITDSIIGITTLGFFNCGYFKENEESKLLLKGYKISDEIWSYYDMLLRARYFTVVDENDDTTKWWDCKVLLQLNNHVLVEFSKPTKDKVTKLWLNEKNFVFTPEGLKVNFCIIP